MDGYRVVGAVMRLWWNVGTFFMTVGERFCEMSENHHVEAVNRTRYLEQRHVAMEAHDRGDHIEVTGCAGRVLRFTR